MRKTLTLISLGLAGWMLAGCEQTQDTLEPADDLDPATEPDVQIGQGEPIDDFGDPADEPEPATPGTIEREVEPTVIQEGETEPGEVDPLEDPSLQPEEDPASPPPQN